MCIICIEWNQGKLTNKEAIRNASEFFYVTDGDDELKEHMGDLLNEVQEEILKDYISKGNKDESTEEELKLL